MAIEIWYLLSYIVGTIFGIWIGFSANGERIVALTIDSLIENGYLRTRKMDDGEIEILPYNTKE